MALLLMTILDNNHHSHLCRLLVVVHKFIIINELRLSRMIILDSQEYPSFQRIRISRTFEEAEMIGGEETTTKRFMYMRVIMIIVVESRGDGIGSVITAVQVDRLLFIIVLLLLNPPLSIYFL